MEIGILNQPIAERTIEQENATPDELLDTIFGDDYASTVIGMEGLVGDMAMAVSSRLKGSISELATKAVGFFKSKNKLAEPMAPLEKMSQDVPFKDIYRLPIAIPVGFKGSLMDYSSMVVFHLGWMAKNTKHVLELHEKRLAEVVENGLDGNIHYTKSFHEEIDTVSAMKEEYAKYFPKKHPSEVALVKDVFSSWSEVIEAHSTVLNKINIDKIPSEKDFREILKIFDRIDELLHRVRTFVTQGSTRSRIRSLKDVGQGIYQLASFVEYLSTATYVYTNLITLTKENQHKILTEGGK